MIHRQDCMTVGELKKLLEAQEDSDVVLIVSECDSHTAIPVSLYPIETSLDRQGVFLLHSFLSKGSVSFGD